VAQLLGFLSLIGGQIPGALDEFLKEFRMRTQATDQHCALVEARLVRLPQEIAAGVDLDRIGQSMGEGFRQQIASVGLESTGALLSSSTQQLTALSEEISAALKLVTHEYEGVSAAISTELGVLTEASCRLREQNAKLIIQERWNGWLWQALLALLLFLFGGLCGLVFEKRHVGDVRGTVGTQMERSQTGKKQQRQPVLSKRNTSRLE
jgi:hypothetical protein